jgi:hypothetical protein
MQKENLEELGTNGQSAKAFILVVGNRLGNNDAQAL